MVFKHDFEYIMQEYDGADSLLQAERQQLLNLKKMLEGQLQLVQQQLQVPLIIQKLY